MSDIKPSVFPTPQQKAAADDRAKLAAFEAEKLAATQEIYINAETGDIPTGQMTAVEQMRLRTLHQIETRKGNGVVYESYISDMNQEPTPAPVTMTKQELEIQAIMDKSKEQMRIRDEHFAKNVAQTQNYQKQYAEAESRPKTTMETPKPKTSTYVQPPIETPVSYGENPTTISPYIIQLSQPNYNSPFDVIPLPSQGKLYRSKKPNVRVSFMTTADENILTSPNLLQSGQFLEILINRKLLESEIRYSDLHVGDRNAIMIWLRATGHGEMYPVTLLDENEVPFDTQINLNELKIKNLGAEPDAEGLFDFQFPLSKANIKFKLLTCGDVDAIERMVEADKIAENPVNNTTTYTFERTIVEVNGSRDKNMIKDFSSSIRIGDAKKLTEYIEEIQSGVDMNITVKTPGGGSVATFLPLNIKFFWPNFGL